MTTPAASPAKRDGEATRQRLLRAALDLFTTVGFRETTTPQIAERAGVAEGTIYRHFQSKEHLLNEAYRGTFRWAAAQVREIDEAERGAKAPEKLARIGRRLLEAAEKDAAAIRMLLFVREERYLDPQSREVARQFRELLQQVVAGGKSDGLVRPGPADLWAGAWLALVGHATERVLGKEWTADHPSAAMVLEAAWAAIAAPAVAAAPTATA